VEVWSSAEPFSRERVRVAKGYGWYRFNLDYSRLLLGETAPYRPAFRLPNAGEMVLRKDQVIHVAGYASESDDHGNRLFHAQGVITHIDHPDVFHYNVDTEGGMSGGPVWIVTDNDEYVVIGVHVGEGMARRVNQALLDELQSWPVPGPAGN
jgi:hypothetical protein